jgi:ATP-dependent DNA helicase PIF1
VFLTGPGGTGKSTIVREFARQCENNGTIVALTALTGVAALQIGGQTLHSWAGIGLGKRSVADLVLKITKFSACRKRWQNTHVLVIDEVSMLSPELLEKLDRIAREIRGSPSSPFGGLQLILTGDFCQLPPVEGNRFCFESPVWKQIIHVTVYLQKVVRQTDPVFQHCLSEIRMGQCSPQTEQLLRSCIGRQLVNDLGIKPTKLYSTRKDVDRMNQLEIEKLKAQGSESKVYKAICGVENRNSITTKQRRFLITRMARNCVVPSSLELVVGAQVMLVHNLDVQAGLVNGSRGVVLALNDASVKVRFLNGLAVTLMAHTWTHQDKDTKTVVSLSQIPLILGYSGTIHKTQSQTLDYVVVDLGPTVFEYGQAYTALSRVRSLKGLQIESFQPNRIKTHPKVKQFYDELLAARRKQKNLDKKNQ